MHRLRHLHPRMPPAGKIVSPGYRDGQRFIESGRFVAASIAPSFAAVFSGWQRKRLPSALRALGFRYVGQTSQGAYQVSAHHGKAPKKNDREPTSRPPARPSSTMLRSTSTKLVDESSPPCLAHGGPREDVERKRHGEESEGGLHRSLRGKEIGDPPAGGRGSRRLRAHIQGAHAGSSRRGIDLSTCEESDFDERPVHIAQLYPLPGGMIKTAGVEDDGFNTADQCEVDGIGNVKEILCIDSPGTARYTLLEPLFCSQGCINGPGIGTEKNLFDRRKDIIEYDRETPADNPVPVPHVESEHSFMRPSGRNRASPRGFGRGNTGQSSKGRAKPIPSSSSTAAPVGTIAAGTRPSPLPRAWQSRKCASLSCGGLPSGGPTDHRHQPERHRDPRREP